MANTSWSPSDKTSGVALSNLNLTAAGTGTNQGMRAADSQTTGKFYWEATFVTVGNFNYGTGIANGSAALTTLYSTAANGLTVYATGSVWFNTANTGLALGSMSSGGIVVCMALDITGKLFWARNGAAGSWNANAGNNPATGVGGINVTAIGTPLYPQGCYTATGPVLTANFGDSTFSGAVPVGFTAGFPGVGLAGTTQARAMVLA